MKKELSKPIKPSKGSLFPASKGCNAAVIEFLRKGITHQLFESVIVPVEVPSGNSFAWVLVRDDALFENADILPPVMTVQGGKALSSLTKHGSTGMKIAAVMRPCEIRAAIELAKLKQIDLENVLLISMDCPGALPIQDYVSNPKKGKEVFSKAIKAGDIEPMRSVCRTCIHFSITAPDLHIATKGLPDDEILIIPVSVKGEKVLEGIGLTCDREIVDWNSEIEMLTSERKAVKSEAIAEIKERTSGMLNLAEVLSKCISCHNCMAVCPVCYCRRCYFESDATELSSEQYLDRAAQKGSIRLSQDVLHFHLGRMSHMTMSCVSCGSCEDACPVDIPVAQLFSAVAEDSQALFEYTPGMSLDDALPLRIFNKDKELCDIERICADPLKGCDCK
jgi:formate dehydrogenase subunit beta